LARDSAVKKSLVERFGGDGVGERDHERGLGAQHAVDLTEHPAEIVDVMERARRHHEIDRRTRGEPQIGEIALVELHLDLGGLGHGAAPGDLGGVGLDGDRLGPGGGEGDRIDLGRHAELDDALARDVTAEPEFAVVRDVGAVGEGKCHVASVAHRGVPGQHSCCEPHPWCPR
jgi:hypothetical protein